MKNLIRIPLTLVLLFAICGFCPGQEFYRGELFVTGQHFSLTDGLLNVELSVDFENLQMPSDESLTVTPVLKNGEYEQELPAVLINGAEKQKVYQRTQALAAGKRNGKVRTSPIPAVVVRNDRAVSRAFTYKVSIPYEEWMEHAVLLLRSQECACHGRKGDSYEDKIADGLRLPKQNIPLGCGYRCRFPFIGEFHPVCTGQGHATLHIRVYPVLRTGRKPERRQATGRTLRRKAELRDLLPSTRCPA